MTPTQTPTQTLTPTLNPTAVAHVLTGAAIVVLVLVQASLAGQYLFYGDQVIVLHGILGNATFALTVVGVVLAIVRRLPGQAFAVAVALLALTFAQVGLGYVGRESQAAASWHIPIGVAIAALAAAQVTMLVGSVRGGPRGR
jgi:hypothetical protein